MGGEAHLAADAAAALWLRLRLSVAAAVAQRDVTRD
jgi:hypothetical protein